MLVPMLNGTVVIELLRFTFRTGANTSQETPYVLPRTRPVMTQNTQRISNLDQSYKTGSLYGFNLRCSLLIARLTSIRYFIPNSSAISSNVALVWFYKSCSNRFYTSVISGLSNSLFSEQKRAPKGSYFHVIKRLFER